MINPRTLNHLTWFFEVIREQYKFVKQDIKFLYNATNLKDDQSFNMTIKRVNMANSLFEIGMNNYRKCLKNMCCTEQNMTKILDTHVKRSRFNLNLSLNELMPLTKARIGYQKELKTLYKKIVTIVDIYNKLYAFVGEK